MRLIVVRHGTAKSKRAWKGRDQDRPLTASGLKQAKAVSSRVARLRPERVISSPSVRCIETVAPLVSARGLRVEQNRLLGTDGGQAAVEWLRRLVEEPPSSSTIAVCTHREVIVKVLPAFASQFGISLGHRLPGAKGSCWILQFREGRLVEIKYWRPSN